VDKGMATKPFPLHLAAQFGVLNAIRALVLGGAELNVRDGKFSGTPLEWAKHNGADDAVELLKEPGAE
jgi:ankyrin repeat protein